MQLPIASSITVDAVRSVAESALPGAPVQVDAPDRSPRAGTRTRAAAFLRASAQRRVRLANRLDPACG